MTDKGQPADEGLDIIKELLRGAIFATYDVIDLDADPSGETVIPGLSLGQAFEKQWQFIEPRLLVWADTRAREARLDELERLGNYKGQYEGRWDLDDAVKDRTAQLRTPEQEGTAA